MQRRNLNVSINFKCLIFLSCFLLNYQWTQAQLTSELSCGNTWTRNSLTGQDLVIPNDFGSNYITITLTGGDGGDAKKTGSICGVPVGKGGAGATVSATFEVGNGADQLKPNGRLRVIVGQAGTTQEASCLGFVDRISGGGGSSAILYLPPEELPVDNNDEWIVVAIAGGGGGGYVDYSTNTLSGGGGRASVNGGNSHTSSGGTSNSCPEVGGTNIVTPASGVGGGLNCDPPQYHGQSMAANLFGNSGSGSLRVILDPNKPASSTGGSSNLTIPGGNGFSGGGAGASSGGGGGGVYGGGVYVGHGGGGGGSYLTSLIRRSNANIQAGTDGGGSPSRGYVALTANNNPVQAIAKNIAVTLDDVGTASIVPGDVDNGSFGGCGGIAYTVSPDAFDCSNIGPNTVVLSVTDRDGNVSTASAVVTVAPSVSVKTKNISRSLNSSGTLAITAADLDNGSSVSCGAIAFMNVSPKVFDCTNIGENTVTLTVTDSRGFSSSATATVAIADDEPPVLQTVDITVQLDENGQASITSDDVVTSASDNCDTPTITLNSNTTFDCSDFGRNTIAILAVDASGNSAAFRAFVNIQSTQVKTKDIMVSLDADGAASITAADVDDGSSTVCGGITSMTVSPNTFTCSDIGPNTVFLTVTDGNGFTTSKAATVTVKTNPGPQARAKSIAISLDADGAASITGSDVNDGSSAGCVSIASMTVSPNTFNCSDIGPNAVDLTVVDLNGNISTAEATVTVEDNIAPIAICQNAIVQLDASGNGFISVAAIDNGSGDACGILNLALDKSSFDCSDAGDNTLTLTLVDVNGNASSCSAVVSVQSPEAETANWRLAPGAKLWPPDYAYQSFAISDMVDGISNVCGALSLEDVWIVQASSDEAEDDPGAQDGNTLDDIVISADCRSVQLRREKMGGGNGRVYTVSLAFQDALGSISYVDYKVQTPKWAWGWNSEAVDDGSVYSVRCKGTVNTAILSEGQTSQTVVPPSRNIRRPDASLEVYPNPFHSETNLKIHLSETAFTTIQVFNLQGQLIRQLHSASLEKGEYRQSWNGTDAKGAPLPSGIYLIQLRIGETILNKKVMLQRF